MVSAADSAAACLDVWIYRSGDAWQLTRSYSSRAISRAPLGRLQKIHGHRKNAVAHDVLRVPAVHKGGRSLSIAFTVGLLYGPQGNVAGILGVIHGETARSAEDRNLRKWLAELEQRERINTTETKALEED